MINLRFGKQNDNHLKVLCLGAHSDDLEIGCGGAILRLLEEYEHTEVYWVVFSGNSERQNEARDSAELFLQNADHKKISIKNFKDSFFPYQGMEIKTYFEEIKKKISPDVIFTHCRHDLHQDHRLISELTWNSFRNHLILEYEIIKYDGDLGAPNLFIPLELKMARKKVENIMAVFKSQGKREWFTDDAFMSIMRIRGMESNAPEKHAEGFYCKKMVI